MNQPAFFKGVAAETAICAYCGYCRTVCPTYSQVGWESCSPRGRIQLAKLMAQGVSLSAAQMARLYECTLCGHCTQVCSTRIDLREFWLAARRQAQGTGVAPEKLSLARDQALQGGNVYGYPNDERAGWAEYMDDAPMDLYQRDQADIVYFVGCGASFAPRVQRTAESFVRLLTAAEADFTILGEGEVCCGFPLLAAGQEDAAHDLIERNLAAFREKGASTVVFTCPACRMMWREHYAAQLPGVRMLHATELLAELAAAGRLRLTPVDRVVTYHDPCDLARNGGVYDAPRALLAAVPGLTFVEAHDRRERALCCGGGGDLEMVDPALASRVAAETVTKLAATGAGAIVTACPQCVRTLSRGAEAAAPGVEVLDIVELLAGALESEH